MRRTLCVNIGDSISTLSIVLILIKRFRNASVPHLSLSLPSPLHLSHHSINNIIMQGAEQEAIVHPPHVHRLLRLIREGTPSHASRASILLGRYAASCCAGVSNITTHSDTEDDGTHQNDDSKPTSSSITNPGLIIWDLIGILVGGDGITATTSTDTNTNGKKGKRKKKKNKKQRPTSGLFDPNWATRTNCALALEYVARCLPLEDRRHFFEGDDDDSIISDAKQEEEEEEEETMLWLNVNDLQKHVDAGIKSEEAKQNKQDEATVNKQQRNKQQRNQNHLDIVAEQGRLLLSSSGAQYDWDCDGEASEYIREQEALQNLDDTATNPTQPQQTGSSMQKELQQTFLMRRVKLQRQILARRLGLGGILSAPIVASHGKTPDESVSSSDVKKGRVIDDIVADEDLVASSNLKKRKQTSSSKGDRTKSKAKQPSKKRRRAKKSEPEQSDTEVKGTGFNIRALLVLESKRAADDVNCKHTRHRNPQTLLGSELAYRTFDPDWTVRHGALLGTLALLRAWKVHDTTQYSSKANGTKHHKKKFGRWPQDILARCVCILALDQFADFSGASCQGIDSTDDEPTVDDIVSGAVVAPVREMSAQIVAILLEASPSRVADCTHRLLNQLYSRQSDVAKSRVGNGWEVRHGVLLAWKYVCAMALFHSTRKEQSKPRDLYGIVNLRPLSTSMHDYNNDLLQRCHSIFNKIVLQSIHGLSDTSDDNRAVAAQVLRHSLLIDPNLYTVAIAKECSKALWDAIAKIREGVSSCAADLLHLLAELLSRDCASFLSSIQDTVWTFSLNSILQKLTGFIYDDSTHVRISCFCALRLVAEPIMRAILDSVNTSQAEGNNTQAQSMDNCVTVLCRLLNRLFETYFSVQYICRVGDALCSENEANDNEAQELSSYRNHAWTAILGSLALLAQSNSFNEGSSCSKIIDDTFAHLTLRYLGISRSSSHWQGGQVNANNKSSKLTRVVDIIGVTDNSFQSKLASSQAIAQCHEQIYSKTEPTYLTEKIHAILQSPWLCQSEAGALLHISLALSTKLESNAESKPFFTTYLPYMTSTFDISPTCLLLDDQHASSEALHGKLGLNQPDLQSISDNGLAMLLDSSSNCSSQDIVYIWHQAFAKKGISFEEIRRTCTESTTEASMGFSASISGALVSCGSNYLPSKVTPLIRALMTSLKNEESQARRNETCRYISTLVSILSENSTYERIMNKLIESVCSTACGRDGNSSGSINGAACVIKLLIANNPGMKMEDFSPINDRLAPFLDEKSSGVSDQEMSDAILMLEILSGAMSKDCHTFRNIVGSCSKPVVDVACTSESEFLRTKACNSIKNLCSIDFCATMELVVPSLLPILSDLHCDQGREGGCKLMLSILHDFEVLVAPYVTTLLPVAMRLMTDPLEACARLASSAFAILVRIAPLAANYIGNDMSAPSAKSEFGEGCKYESDDVIQHLILGKPLPQCILPEVVSSELKSSATTLRPYQMEGVSWLKFLTSVSLNGALCDDMGLGKTLQSLVAVAISHYEQSGESKDFALKEEKKSLVICPSSVVGHWVSEIKRFFPSNEIFAPFDFTGTEKRRRAAWQEGVQKSNIVVTSYSVLRTDVNLLEGTSWNYCILDEGHLLKNPKTGGQQCCSINSMAKNIGTISNHSLFFTLYISATAKASRRLKARHKLILTGKSLAYFNATPAHSIISTRALSSIQVHLSKTMSTKSGLHLIS